MNLKKIMAFLMFILVLGATGFAEDKGKGKSEPTKWTVKALTALFVDFLKAEGFKPKYEADDGIVLFETDEGKFFIQVDADDPTCFRLYYPGFYSFKTTDEQFNALVAADFVNAKLKVAKVFAIKSNMWVSVEVFVADPTDFKAFFKRSIRVINQAVEDFKAKLKELKKAKASN